MRISLLSTVATCLLSISLFSSLPSPTHVHSFPSPSLSLRPSSLTTSPSSPTGEVDSVREILRELESQIERLKQIKLAQEELELEAQDRSRSEEEVDISGDEKSWNDEDDDADEEVPCPFMAAKAKAKAKPKAADQKNKPKHVTPRPRAGPRPHRHSHKHALKSQTSPASIDSADASDDALAAAGLSGFPFPIQLPAGVTGAIQEWTVNQLDFVAKQLKLTGPPTSFQSPDPNPHESGTAAAKQAAIWQKVTANTKNRPYDPPINGVNIFLEDMDPTIHWVSDQIPQGRVKAVHQVGLIAKAHLTVTDYAKNHYTGALRTGWNHLIVRLSSANDPNQANQSVAPGIAIKFLRDNRPSGNMVALREADARGNYFNFFTPTIQTHLKAINSTFPAEVVGIKFRQVTTMASYTGVSDICRFEEDGTMIPFNQIKHPFQVVLKPNPVLRDRNVKFDGVSWFDQFQDIKAGTKLYDIYAQDEPLGPLSPLLGSLYLDTDPTTSYYGDATLFFKHQVVDEDFMLRPDWKTQCPKDVDCEQMF